MASSLTEAAVNHCWQSASAPPTQPLPYHISVQILGVSVDYLVPLSSTQQRSKRVTAVISDGEHTMHACFAPQLHMYQSEMVQFSIWNLTSFVPIFHKKPGDGTGAECRLLVLEGHRDKSKSCMRTIESKWVIGYVQYYEWTHVFYFRKGIASYCNQRQSRLSLQESEPACTSSSWR